MGFLMAGKRYFGTICSWIELLNLIYDEPRVPQNVASSCAKHCQKSKIKIIAFFFVN